MHHREPGPESVHLVASNPLPSQATFVVIPRASPPMTVSPPADLLDPEAIRRLRELDPSGGNKLLERVVAAFSSSLDRLLVDLARAREGDPIDLAAVRHVSHTLKSSSASLGATALAARCADIETLAREGRVEGLCEQLDAMLQDIQQVRAALAALL
jgi:histidine phosphotransfer protein HptB